MASISLKDAPAMFRFDLLGQAAGWLSMAGFPTDKLLDMLLVFVFSLVEGRELIRKPAFRAAQTVSIGAHTPVGLVIP